jgi:hypothetical protein
MERRKFLKTAGAAALAIVAAEQDDRMHEHSYI